MSIVLPGGIHIEIFEGIPGKISYKPSVGLAEQMT